MRKHLLGATKITRKYKHKSFPITQRFIHILWYKCEDGNKIHSMSGRYLLLLKTCWQKTFHRTPEWMRALRLRSDVQKVDIYTSILTIPLLLGPTNSKVVIKLLRIKSSKEKKEENTKQHNSVRGKNQRRKLSFDSSRESYTFSS